MEVFAFAEAFFAARRCLARTAFLDMESTATPHVEHFFAEQGLVWPLTHFFGCKRRIKLPAFDRAGFETPLGTISRPTAGLLAAVTLGIDQH